MASARDSISAKGLKGGAVETLGPRLFPTERWPGLEGGLDFHSAKAGFLTFGPLRRMKGLSPPRILVWRPGRFGPEAKGVWEIPRGPPGGPPGKKRPVFWAPGLLGPRTRGVLASKAPLLVWGKGNIRCSHPGGVILPRGRPKRAAILSREKSLGTEEPLKCLLETPRKGV